MKVLLGILLFVVIALAGHRRSFKALPLGASHLFLTGIEYILVGLCLGDALLGVLDRRTLDALSPFMVLGLGWVGLLYGVQLDLRRLASIGGSVVSGALLQGALTALVVFAAMFALLRTLTSVGTLCWPSTLVLAAVASCTASSSLALIAGRRRSDPALDFALLSASLDDLVAITTLACALCFMPVFPGRDVPFDAWHRVIYSIGLGVVTGVIMNGIARGRGKREELFVVVLGLVIFSGAAALFFRVSPLFTSLLAGLVVGNLSGQREKIIGILLQGEKPLYLVFLVFAGASWRPEMLHLLLLVPIYVTVRLAGKGAGGALSARLLRRNVSLPYS
ncbi:hypothetical protein ACFL4G_09680, partial [Thermodesulfobacteriota bacterium]